MSDASVSQQVLAHEPEFGDYVELLKPRVMRLVVFTAFVGLVSAPMAVHPVIGFASILCIAVGAGAAAAEAPAVESPAAEAPAGDAAPAN